MEQAELFENSLTALARIAVREADAAGYSFFKKGVTDAWTWLLGEGTTIPEAALPAGLDGRVIAYPLAGEGGDGILAFALRAGARRADATPRLNRMVEAIAQVWAVSQSLNTYLDMARRLAELDASLIDSKIAERARGLLSSGGSTDAVESIIRHVHVVLQGASASHSLERIVLELREELEERKLASRAKDILQRVHGMSEAQAHEHIRTASRRSRRRVKDIALETIAQNIHRGAVA